MASVAGERGALRGGGDQSLCGALAGADREAAGGAEGGEKTIRRYVRELGVEAEYTTLPRTPRMAIYLWIR